MTNEIGRIERSIGSASEPVSNPASQTRPSEIAINENATRSEYVDVTSLSPAGSLVAKALEQPDTPSLKVASLQKAIATGAYSVSSSDVADKIVEDLLK